MAKKAFKPDVEPDIGLQIAPMVNLMFVLLAAFTVAAGEKIVENELGVQVPTNSEKVKTEQKVLNPPVNILIYKDGSVSFNKNPIGEPEDTELASLKDRLKRLVEVDSDQSVVIRPDPDAKHQRVIDVLNACTYAKVKKLSFGG
ncbi:MAG: biopolymer transporter ExbD [Verrucomicrobiota bacterium]